MTNTGKIARLPKYIRDQLNQRLDDGQSANDILRWLNRLPECKKVLAEKFDSRPITRQNLSQWKQGGYQAWLGVQQAREQVQSLVEQADDLEKDNQYLTANDGMTIADRLGALVAVQLLSAIQKLDDITDPDQRWQRLTEIVSQLSRLRREDHHGRRVRLAREQWQDKCRRQEALDEKDRKKAESGRLIAWASSLFTTKDRIESHGGGEMGRRWADWFHRVENDLPLPKWFPGPWADTHFGPDGADWSKVRLPDEPKASSSSPVAPKSDEGGSFSNRTKASPSHSSAGLPTLRDANSANAAKPADTARNTNHETRNSEPIPSPETSHPLASPKPQSEAGLASPKLPREGGSPSSSDLCKVNQSKSNQQQANVPSLASPVGQPNPDSSRRSPNEDGSKSNQPCADAPIATRVKDGSASLPAHRDSKDAKAQSSAPSENYQPSDSNPSPPDPGPLPQ